jgi:hypothetical protein
VTAAAQDKPRAARPPRPLLDDLPAAGHAQVAAQHEPAFEAQEQVLANSLDGEELAAVKPLGDALTRSPRVRRLNADPLADEHLKLARRTVERVAFGHGGVTLAARSTNLNVRILPIIAAASSLTACGAQGSDAAGGLFGRVWLNPATPVCTAGTPCTKPANGLHLVFVRDGHRAASVITDRRGRYRVRLSDGRYVVRTGAADGVGQLRPSSVTVRGGPFIRRNFTYDSGIR